MEYARYLANTRAAGQPEVASPTGSATGKHPVQKLSARPSAGHIVLVPARRPIINSAPALAITWRPHRVQPARPKMPL
jgi:hypothetical protein